MAQGQEHRKIHGWAQMSTKL